MNSIHQRLLAWILGVLILSITVAGTTTYLMIRHTLRSSVERELQQARKVVFNLLQQGRLSRGAFAARPIPDSQRLRFRDEQRWEEFDRENGELLYQLRNASGEIVLCSTSLDDRTIASPPSLPNRRRSIPLAWNGDSRIRGRVDYLGANRKPAPPPGNEAPWSPGTVEIVVARDLAAIDRTLTVVLVAISVVASLIALATAWLVSFILRRILAPLQRLAIEASEIDADSLAHRFGDERTPHELRPICGRLNLLLERLEESFERERRFSSDLAHELRTPIAEISTMAEGALLHPEKFPPERHRDYLEAARDMQRIVDSLLELARWEQGTESASEESIQIALFVEECWMPYRIAAEARGLRLERRIEPTMNLTINPGLFRNILANLFSNAVEYTPRGGKLIIESHGSGISVANTVEGFDPDELPHLFERFWRADRSRTGNGHSGLGLSLARACAETLSWTLTASLEEDTLRFDLCPAGHSACE